MRAAVFRVLALLFLICFFHGGASSATAPASVTATEPANPAPRILSPAEQRADLAGAIWLLEDPAGSLTIDDIRDPQVQGRFRPWDADRGDLNLSFSTSAWWVRVRLQGHAQDHAHWILEVPYAYNKYLDFHAPGDPAVLTGHARPLESRPLSSRHFAFAIDLPDTPQDYYFRVKSSYAVSLPLVAWMPAAYARHTLNSQWLEALYHGALLTMMVYAAFVWGSIRDGRFGYYALYGACLNLAMLAGNGWGHVFLWSRWPRFDEVSSGVFLSLTMAAFLMFVRRFLRTGERAPRALDRAMRAGAVIGAVHALAMLASMGHEAWTTRLFHGLSGLGAAMIVMVSLTLCVPRVRRGPGMGYFTASWLILTLGLLVAMLRIYGWVPTNGLTSYAVQIASGVEMLLLSLTLAQIVRHERDERLRARSHAMEAQQQVIDLLKEQEQMLERTVAQRTQSLDAALQRERATLAEYLRFAALVSHEFRNGLNVISSQSDLLRQQPQDAAQVDRRARTIRQHVQRLSEMTDKWLRSDRAMGTDAAPEVRAVAAGPWLEAFLAGHPQLQEQHPLRWEVADEAPLIRAEPALLDVVALNLLDNARKYSPPGSPITVRTVAAPGMAGLQVADQGPGIEAHLHGKVFERYFRVQPEGPVSGTGLGLSFVRHVAQQHGGRVELQSQPGRGSVFTVWFPDGPLEERT